ncbi:hypothetical protein RHMOL_Rhmol07G0252000 [Rhododendron molle]|uniref:Uncharacterized protein n=1 Tax=Rhododendron molle TaxID=49168 RepID=A0ACC0N693_RHOML|nr:hypothetical protein RHMOL_Rhmol07G0252000 [Rhododendron molle]
MRWCKMPSFGDVFRLIWNLISMGLEYKSNWYMRFMLGLCSVIAVVMFFIGYGSEGGEVSLMRVSLQWSRSARVSRHILSRPGIYNIVRKQS